MMPRVILVTLLATGASAQVDTLSMTSNADQVDGVDACYTHEIRLTGSGLSPVTVTPPGGSPITILPEAGAWFFESICFASKTMLEQAFPRDEVDPYRFALGGTSDSDDLLYSNVDFPSCFAIITTPAHNGETGATPTIEWTVTCAVAPGNCHYAVEVAATDEPIIEKFFTDCGGSNSLQVPSGVLAEGVSYRFWVELTAGDDGNPATTDTLDSYTYFQGTQNSNEIEFMVTPCADTDSDSLCDEEDPCKFFPNTLPLVISGFSGIPDECLCGDFDGNGSLSATDASAVNACAAFVRLDCVPDRDEVSPPYNGFYSATDASLINRVAGFADPAYTLKCGLRPEGTCGGDTGVSCLF